MTETDIDLTDAVAAIRRGDLVVYPTETVYGLAADALDPEAIERVFEAKGRARDKPISMALPDAEVARDFAEVSDREASFCARFLPGPVTVLLERTDRVPDVLVAGEDRVGIRVPDHDLSRELARRTGPITSTSANKSGQPSARRVEDIAPEVRERAAVVLDTGETPGTESTVVNIAENDIVRRGARADEIEGWLAEN
ncbi:L-threonylcarbamoyladenylate synthase [Natronomonas halophila]|uniref:L-threonylcarbamoyladenylate synthase n=1 Tax=Natronomonas halophila TaxID=2747817 RepID=UPI001FE319BD|nr:L-threonylcarbamoyladenylate synthase [Natronomonas halophila]